MKLKFVIRRMFAGIVIVPSVAGIYFVGYATLVGAGAEPTATASEVWNNGLVIGVMATLVLMFWEPLNALLNKWGE